MLFRVFSATIKAIRVKFAGLLDGHLVHASAKFRDDTKISSLKIRKEAKIETVLALSRDVTTRSP